MLGKLRCFLLQGSDHFLGWRMFKTVILITHHPLHIRAPCPPTPPSPTWCVFECLDLEPREPHLTALMTTLIISFPPKIEIFEGGRYNKYFFWVSTLLCFLHHGSLQNSFFNCEEKRNFWNSRHFRSCRSESETAAPPLVWLQGHSGHCLRE